MHRPFIIIVFVSYFVLSGCSSWSAHSPKRDSLSLNDIEKVDLLGMNRKKAENVFGPPDVVIPRSQSKEEFWIYTAQEGVKRERLGLVFDITNGLLSEMNWHVYESDPEHLLSVAKKRFPQAHFQKKMGEYGMGHSPSPQNIVYQDKGRGLAILTRGDTEKVFLLTWSVQNK